MHSARLPLAGILVRSDRSARRVRRVLPTVRAIYVESTIPPADYLLIAVPDDSVGRCAAALANQLGGRPGTALHTSGVLPAAVLAPLARRQWSVGSFHPLTAFPRPGGPLVPLRGILAAIEGEPAALRVARSLAKRLAIRVHLIDPRAKPRYHAAAALAANLTHILVVAARQQFQQVGLSRRGAAEALAPLVFGAISSALASTGWEHLTGAVVRHDLVTVRRHLRVLPPDLAEAYAALARFAADHMESDRSSASIAFREQLAALTLTRRYASVRRDDAT